MIHRPLAMLLGAALCCAPALAQDKAKAPEKAAPPAAPKPPDAKKAEPSMDAQMKAWMDSAKPGPMHKWLADSFEGEWTTEVRNFGPDGKEMGPATKGSMMSKSIMDGRFISMNFKGEAMGQPFHGMGTTGYNNTDKRFESVWWDSMGSGIMWMTGSTDKDGKVLTLIGDMTEPDGSKSKMKEVTTILSKDSHKSDFFMIKDGKEFKNMEIAYTRAKGGEKGEKKDEKKETKKDKGSAGG